MVRCVTILWLLLAVLGVFSADPPYWSYYESGPDTWHQSYPNCGGKKQSPINIIRKDAIQDTKFDLQFIHYNNKLSGTIRNTGYTVDFALDEMDNSLKPQVYFTSNGHNGTYHVHSIHFHIPADHRYDSELMAGEMHVMHSNSNGEVLGLSVPVTTCKEDPGKSLLSVGLLDALKNLIEVGNSKSLTLDPAAVLEDGETVSRCDFYRYEGSLTWPPCTENVLWLVNERSICTNEEMMEAFNKILGVTGRPMKNSRPVQPLNDRKVFFHPCSKKVVNNGLHLFRRDASSPLRREEDTEKFISAN